MAYFQEEFVHVDCSIFRKVFLSTIIPPAGYVEAPPPRPLQSPVDIPEYDHICMDILPDDNEYRINCSSFRAL